MNRFLLLAIGAVFSVTALLLIAEPASASTNCHASGNWCQGWAQVSTTTGGVSSTRCFSLRVTNTAPTCATTTSNEATWEMDAGSCITLRYFDTTTGAVPPSVPNKVTIQERFDSTGTIINTHLSAGAEPANGSTFSFCATSTGLAGGAARAGTYRVYLNAVKDNGAGGVGNYNIDSDGTASVGAITTFDKGALRGKIQVASIARSAYPAGSTFSYGSAADESVTVTASFTTPNGDANVENGLDGVIDAATLAVGKAGTSIDIDSSPLAQAIVVDNVLPFANSPYVPYFQITGNAVLTGLPWTTMASAGHGANIVTPNTIFAYDSTSFNIDSRIRADSTGSHTFATADETDVTKITSSSGALAELFNKGETVYHEWFIFNSRSEKLSRSMTTTREDSTNTQCATYNSLTPTANKYSTTTTLSSGSTCLAAADTTGSSRHLRITNTNQNYASGTIFFVSSLLRFDQDGVGTPDNLVVTCLGVGGCPGATIRVFNRGERVDFEGYLINARGTLYQETGITWRAADSLNGQVNSQTISHSSGKYSGNDFPLSSSELAVADTVGDSHAWTATKDGNTATSAVYVFGVSSLYFTDAHVEISATLVKDDYPTENSAEDQTYTISVAQTDTTHGWCHVKGVRKDVDIVTSASRVTWTYRDPTAAVRTTGTTDTGSDGWTNHFDLLASTPLGAWNFICDVNFSGNTATNSQQFNVTVTGGGGGDTLAGDPLKIFAAPVIANANEAVLFTISESFLNGTGRTGNAAGTFIYIYNPSNTAIVNGVNVTEINFGIYNYAYGLGPSPTTGNWYVIVRTTDPTTGLNISSSNTFRVEPDGDLVSVALNGQTLKLFAAPVIANPSESVLFTISETAINGTSRTGNAVGTLLYIYDPSGTIVVNGAAATEVQFGIYSYSYSLGASPASGNWFAIAKITDPTTNATVATANNFRVESDGDLIVPTNFETLTGVSAFEFMVLLGILFLAVLFWSRSTDFLIKFTVGILCFIPAIIWMLLFVKVGWKGDLAFAAISGALGGYLLVRAGMDKALGRGEGT